MKHQKLLTVMGFAAKAGAIISGETGCLSAIKKNRACLLIIAEDAAESTRTSFQSNAAQKQLPVITGATKDEMGRAIGKSPRSILVIIKKDFARQIDDLLST